MDTDFDVIVVGAGPAGLAAAYILADAGVDVIVIERGEYPGSKNVMGGVLYRYPTEQIIPKFYESAPLERAIVEQNFWLLSDESAFKVGYRSDQFGEPPYNNHTVLRAKFDRWMAEETEEVGATLITDTTVEEVLQDERGRVVGVRTGRPDGELYARCVILAEGVNNLLTESLGLAEKLSTVQAAVTVKEILELPREKIEDRFGLEEGQGATIEMVGEATYRTVGTAFLYTNKNTLSLGVGAIVAQVVEERIDPHDMLEHVKNHPSVQPLVEGAEIKEYSAKLIPEGAYHKLPQIFSDGVLVVGDAARLVNAIHREGSNMAMMSGKYAADTVLEAIESNDFSKKTLSRYKERMENSFILKDLKKYGHANEFFKNNPRFFNDYVDLVHDASHELMTVDNVAKAEKQSKIFNMVRKKNLWTVAGDLFRAWRALG